ncbi:MAG: hypothetical protein ACP5GX_01890 [Anaerolineae bacterium]
MDPALVDSIGVFVGVAVTLAIGSYLIGDNPVYRWVLALLVGVGTGYGLAIAVNFLRIWFVDMQVGTLPLLVAVPPLVLGVLLWFKISPRLSPVGNFSMAFILGVGGAVAITGALLGTLLPQMAATGAGVSLQGDGLVSLVEGGLILVGTILALLVFSPRATHAKGGTRNFLLWARKVGRIFIIVALAAAFAGAITSGLTLFFERLWSFVLAIFPS